MTKKVIAIISVLKPVDDTRNYEKIATSLGNTNKYDLNIIGFKSKNIPTHAGITFYPEFNFSRSSLRRCFASWIIWNKLIKLKPELIVVTCAELLLVTVLYKIFFGGKIVYDVQENYFRNFLYSGAYHTFFKFPLAILSRFLECATSPFINFFFLAEEVYKKQLAFTSNRRFVLPNTALIPSDLIKLPKIQQEYHTFLYCGTITRHYGILDAITFFTKLNKHLPKSRMRIIGHAPNPGFFEQLILIARQNSAIEIIGDGSLIPHNEVLKEILNADFVLMPYHSGKNIDGRIPTKLYECIAMQVPVIISPSEHWNQLISITDAGIIYDFNQPLDIKRIEPLLKKKYYQKPSNEAYLWSSTEPQLLSKIQSLLES